MKSQRPLSALLLYAHPPGSSTYSYYHGWPRHFQKHPAFDVTPVNLCDRFHRARLVFSPRRFDAVVLLHSTFSNSRYLSPALLERVRRFRAVKAWFIGNEYKLMPAKIAFAERLGVDLLVSQLDAPEAHALYRNRLACEVTWIPNTGLDTELFFPGPPLSKRPVDLGYRAAESPSYLGHVERTELVERFREAAGRYSLRVDLALDDASRLDEPGWARFLQSCKGQLGSESGGDYFELTDATRDAVLAAEKADLPLSFADVYERFFRHYSHPVSGRALSGRIVEAAGTETVQLLLEGRYGGMFRPGEHYLSVRKDFTNLDEVLDSFADESECRRLTQAAHELARSELTYERLIDRFRVALTPLIEASR